MARIFKKKLPVSRSLSEFCLSSTLLYSTLIHSICTIVVWRHTNYVRYDEVRP